MSSQGRINIILKLSITEGLNSTLSISSKLLRSNHKSEMIGNIRLSIWSEVFASFGQENMKQALPNFTCNSSGVHSVFKPCIALCYTDICLEPIGGSAPKFSAESSISDLVRGQASSLAMACPAQASPVPSFRSVHCGKIRGTRLTLVEAHFEHF